MNWQDYVTVLEAVIHKVVVIAIVRVGIVSLQQFEVWRSDFVFCVNLHL